jgi:hypothetical protein
VDGISTKSVEEKERAEGARSSGGIDRERERERDKGRAERIERRALNSERKVDLT